VASKTKDDILKAALQLFGRKGYLQTSMSDVAEATGLTKGGIYHHIGKKEDLLRLIHNQMTDAFLERFRQSGENESEPQSKLMSWIEAHASLMRDYQPHIKVFFTELEHLTQDDGFEQVVKKRDDIYQTLYEIIVAGIQARQFRPDVQPTIVTLLIFGMLNWFYQWYRPDGPLSMEEIIKVVKQFVRYGILSNKKCEGE
jgi:AcrR family transcriptional regulator